MLFNSLEFLVFLVVVYGLYWVMPRWQRFLLLLASLFFYGWWNPPYLGLVFLSAGVDFVAAKRVVAGAPHRKAWLWASMVSNLTILGSFKYYDFFMDNVVSGLAAMGIAWTPPAFDVLLPMGISFYTFQSMSYTIDVYRGQYEPEQKFWRFVLFVTFFPQMVAGPIMRPSHLIPQLRDGVRPVPADVAVGLTFIARGYMKKLVFADTLAPLVSRVFADPAAADGGQSLFAVYAFAVQIYGDFAGYSDIAIGLGRMFGYDITQNFAHPYQSASITEFWRRWHISLSHWLRDYLYISLGGNRFGNVRTYANLMMTMLLGGLWHGAGWNFVIWGGLHGGYLAIERWLGVKPEGPEPPFAQKWIRRFVVFHLVCLAWIFFRADRFDVAMTVIGNIATKPYSWSTLDPFAVLLVLGFAALHEVSRRLDWYALAKRTEVQAATYATLAMSALILFRRVPSEFIYFQF